MTTLVWLFLGMSVIITAYLTYTITSKVKENSFKGRIKRYNKTNNTNISL